MALDPDVLSVLLEVGMLDNPIIQATEGEALTALCNVIAQAVIEHITNDAEVSGTCTGTAGGDPIVGGSCTGSIT